MFVSFLRIVLGESDSVAVGTGGACPVCGRPRDDALRSRRSEPFTGLLLLPLFLLEAILMPVVLLLGVAATRRLGSVAKGIKALIRMSSVTATQTGLRRAG